MKVIVLPDMKYSRVHKLFWYTNTIGKKMNSAFSLELPHFELEFDNFCGHYIVETYLFQLWKWILIFLYSSISNIAPETNRKLRKVVFVKLFWIFFFLEMISPISAQRGEGEVKFFFKQVRGQRNDGFPESFCGK